MPHIQIKTKIVQNIIYFHFNTHDIQVDLILDQENLNDSSTINMSSLHGTTCL